MSRLVVSALLLLAGCAATTPPSQPTPESIQAANVRLSAIAADPVTTWQVGNWAVRAACHAYLNDMATRSANLNFGGSALGLSGPAAAGFLIAKGNPWGAAAATGMAALGQTFLNLYNSSGAIPYTTETSGIIEQSLNAYEMGVNMAPPQSVPQAVSYVDDLWWQCSPGGYAMLVSKAIGTANIGVQMNGMFSFRSLAPTGRPVIMVNPSPSTVTNPTSEQPLSVQPRLHHKLSSPISRQPTGSQEAASLSDDPDRPARLRWLRETSTYIPALDGPR